MNQTEVKSEVTTYTMYFFLIFLFWKGFVNCNECPIETDMIQNCAVSDQTIVGSFKYEIRRADREIVDWKICPVVTAAEESAWWSVKMFDDSGVEITSGLYCSSLGAYNSSHVCMNANGTLHIDRNSLSSTEGLLELLFTSSVLTTNITIRYASTGVYRLNQPNVVEVDEGVELLGLAFIVFYRHSPSLAYLHNEDEMTNGILDNRCISSTTGVSTDVVIIQIMPVERSSAGVYAVQFTDNYGEQFESNITLQVNVAPDPSSSVIVAATPTFQSSSTITTPTTITTTTTITTPTTTTTSSSLSSTIVWLIIAVGVFFAVAIVIILIVVVVLCCYVYVKRSAISSPTDHQPERFMLGPNHESTKGTSKARHGSASSERPLTASGSTPSVNVPTSDGMSDYTAVYCSEEYTQCGVLLKQKHGDRINIITEWEDVRLAIVQPSCTDILLFASPADDVFKEVMTCGIDPSLPDKRSKLRIVMFTSEDHFPSCTIGVNGYRVVLAGGSPSSIDTLLTAINKAEFPELKNELIQSKKRLEETDSNNLLQRQIVELLKQLLNAQNTSVALQQTSVGIQRDNLEVNREQAELMEQKMVGTSPSTDI